MTVAETRWLRPSFSIVAKNLQRQFSRRCENQCLRLAFRQDREPFDHGDNKRRRLAGTGLGATNDVPALKGRWNGLSLNGSGNQQARCRQIPQKRFRQTKGVKTLVNRGMQCTILSV